MQRLRALVAVGFTLLGVACKQRPDSALKDADVGVAATWWQTLKTDLTSATGDSEAMVVKVNAMSALVVTAQSSPDDPSLQNQVQATQDLGSDVSGMLTTLLNHLGELQSTLATGSSPNPAGESLRQVPVNRPVTIDGVAQDWGVAGVTSEITDLTIYIQTNLYSASDGLAMRDTSAAEVARASDAIADFSIKLDTAHYWLIRIKQRTDTWFDANQTDYASCGALTKSVGGSFANANCKWFPSEAYFHFMPPAQRPCDASGPAEEGPGTAILPANQPYYDNCTAEHAKIKGNLQAAITALLGQQGVNVWGDSGQDMTTLGTQLGSSALTVTVQPNGGAASYDTPSNAFTIPLHFYADDLTTELTRLFKVQKKPPPPAPTVQAPQCAVTIVPPVASVGTSVTVTVALTGGDAPDSAFLMDAITRTQKPITLPYTSTVTATATEVFTCGVQNSGGANQGGATLTVSVPPPPPPPSLPPAPVCAITLTPSTIFVGQSTTVDITVPAGSGPVVNAWIIDTSAPTVVTPIAVPYHAVIKPDSTRGIFCRVANAGGQNQMGAALAVSPAPVVPVVTPLPPPVGPPPSPFPPPMDMNLYAYTGGRPLMKGQTAWAHTGAPPAWLSMPAKGSPPASDWTLRGNIRVFSLDPVNAGNNVGLVAITLCAYDDPKMNGNNLVFPSTPIKGAECVLPPGIKGFIHQLTPAEGGLLGYVYAGNVKPGLRPLYRCPYNHNSAMFWDPATCGAKTILGWGL